MYKASYSLAIGSIIIATVYCHYLYRNNICSIIHYLIKYIFIYLVYSNNVSNKGDTNKT